MRALVDESMTVAFDHSQTDLLLGQIMQSLQVGPGAAAQSDVETAHAQFRCPLSQSVAMGEDRIVFAKIDTGKNAERGFDFRNSATGVRGEICECCSLGALRQAEQ